MLLGVDVGGTFTDAVLVGADAGGGSSVHTAKVPTTAGEQALGVLEAVALVLERAGARAGDVRRFAHGMTVTTNALLEGRTARTALIATDGFTDVIELARQARPHLYRLCDAAPAPLVPAELRFAAPERIAPDGVLRALDPGARPGARAARRRRAGPRPSPWRCCTPTPTRATSGCSASCSQSCLPGVPVSLSSELVGTFREYERTATTALDAALSPLLGAYLRRLAAAAREQGLAEPQIMQSSGGLTDIARASAHAALTVLSGPRRRRRRRAAAGPARRRARRALLRHGRHLLRRLPDRRRRGVGDRRALRRRAPARAARARHPHRRRRRRLDRLARLRRRAARRAAERRRRPRARLLRARRRAAPP